MRKRLFRKHHMDLYTKERFEIDEPQPLGFSNVMFCFMSLGFGCVVSLLFVILELIRNHRVVAAMKEEFQWAIPRAREGPLSGMANRANPIIMT